MTPARTQAFDALRGIAAACVVLSHYLAAFWPATVFGPSARWVAEPAGVAGGSALFWCPPLSLATAAHFSVCLFFVLSGYVLSVGFVARPDGARLLGAALKRGPRLAGVVLASIALAIALIEFGALFDEPLAELTGSRWIASFWDTPFSWERFAAQAVRLQAGAEYVPPLWTLKIELIGSALVFALLAIGWRLPPLARHALLALALALTWGRYYDGFVVGVWLAWLAPALTGTPEAMQRRATADASRAVAAPARASARRLLALAGVVLIASMPFYAAEALWPRLSDRAYPASVLQQVPMLAAMALFALVLTTPTFRRPLERPGLARLGDRSYALYATHFLVLGSLSAWLVTTLAPTFGVGVAAMLSCALSLPVLWSLAAAVTRWVDEPSIALARRIDRTTRRALERKGSLDTTGPAPRA